MPGLHPGRRELLRGGYARYRVRDDDWLIIFICIFGTLGLGLLFGYCGVSASC